MGLLHRAFLVGLLGLPGLAALPASAADPLGRLFMTPEQRHGLDALRESGGELSTSAGTPAPAAPFAADKQVVLSGVVRRSLGPDVVWVNGSRADGTGGRIRVRQGPDRSSRVTLENAADGSTARLKPGQYWEPATGRVANCSGCGVAARPAEVPAIPVEDAAAKP